MALENTLVIATISAGSAIAGAVISQFFSLIRDWFDKKHQRKIWLRTKFEEFAGLVSDSQEWGNSLYHLNSLEEHNKNPPAQARRAMILAYIYFPLLREQSEKFMNSCVCLQKIIVANFPDRPSDLIEQPIKDFNKNRQELDKLIIKHASEYSKA
ncbi:MAG: hypothetical protein NDI81_04320 [Desulfobacula sp.]|nr:hypothetical protein [Desulfobacula sp.]